MIGIKITKANREGLEIDYDVTFGESVKIGDIMLIDNENVISILPESTYKRLVGLAAKTIYNK